jgi:hypothetical protein
MDFQLLAICAAQGGKGEKFNYEQLLSLVFSWANKFSILFFIF